MKFLHIKSYELYVELFHDLIDLSDTESIRFSNFAIGVHNSLYGWNDKFPLALVENGAVVSVLFYNITKRDRYITILNIVTPVKYRCHGYAKKLIAYAVSLAHTEGKTRIRLNCDMIPGTIKFYDKLGMVYWGVTRDKALYCNLPLLSGNIEDFKRYSMLRAEDFLDQSAHNLITRRLDLDLSEMYRNHELVDKSRYMFDTYLKFNQEK